MPLSFVEEFMGLTLVEEKESLLKKMQVEKKHLGIIVTPQKYPRIFIIILLYIFRV